MGKKNRKNDDSWEAEADVLDPEAAAASLTRAELESSHAAQMLTAAAERKAAAALLSALLETPPPLPAATLDALLDLYTSLKKAIDQAESAGIAADGSDDERAITVNAKARLDTIVDAANAVAPAADDDVPALAEELSHTSVGRGASKKGRKGKKGGSGGGSGRKQKKPADEDWEDEADILDAGDGSDGEATSGANKCAALVSARVAALARAKVERDEAAGGFASMRTAYDELGAEGYYEAHGDEYTNPHEPTLAVALHVALEAWRPLVLDEGPLRRGLDYACGSGEATAAFEAWAGAAACALEAADPYTYAAYEKRMGRPAHRWSFEDVAGGALDEQPPYDICLSSFALHLIEPQWLHLALSALARSARLLIVLTPHKRPVIDHSTGWRAAGEIVHERVRVRLYKSDGARRLEGGASAE